MSEIQITPEQKLQVFHTRFNQNIMIASKPLNDVIEAFDGYMRSANMLIAQKNAEIAMWKSKVVKEVNVPIPEPESKKPESKKA